MQLGEDQLDARNALFWVDVHRHASAIVQNLQRIVLMQNHLNRAGMPSQRFIDAVVDDFLCQMIWPRGVGVHTRTLAHRIKAGEDFNGFCGIRHGRFVVSLKIGEIDFDKICRRKIGKR